MGNPYKAAPMVDQAEYLDPDRRPARYDKDGKLLDLPGETPPPKGGPSVSPIKDDDDHET